MSFPGESTPHPKDVWRDGYKQKTFAWQQYLLGSPDLRRVMYRCSARSAAFFRRNAKRSPGPGPHTADMVRIESFAPGGAKFDRMEYRVVAYGPNAAMEEFGGKANHGKPRAGNHTLRKSLVYISGGKKITRGGKIV